MNKLIGQIQKSSPPQGIAKAPVGKLSMSKPILSGLSANPCLTIDIQTSSSNAKPFGIIDSKGCLLFDVAPPQDKIKISVPSLEALNGLMVSVDGEVMEMVYNQPNPMYAEDTYITFRKVKKAEKN